MKLIFSTLMLLLLVTGISFSKSLSGVEKEKLYEIAEPIIVDVIEGYNNDDYGVYSKYFDEQLKHTFPEKVFKQVVGNIKYKIGKFVSRTRSNVISENQYKVVLYTGKFEKEKNVVIRLVLQKYKEKYFISGIWFNSPKLRE